MRQFVGVILFGLILNLAVVAQGMALGIPQIQHLSKDDFLSSAFSGGEPGWKMLRLNRELKQRVQAILTHRYPASRIRYWHKDQRTAWIIDEIGKEQPITIGVVVEHDRIVQLKILVYREERGGEVHQDFFTRQFINAQRQNDGISRHIDGITGATLSVDAVTRVAALALMLHHSVHTQLAINP